MQRRLVHLLTAALVPSVAVFGLAATPASAASPTYSSSTQYVAMGDSYSAGLGAPGATEPCGVSPQGYPTLWANAHGITSFTNATCSGATAANVLSTQISSLSAQTNVVTITIGGNDVALGGLVSTCLGGDQACATATEQLEANLPTSTAQVAQAYAAIRQAAPHAQVYVLDYPHLFEPSLACLDLAPDLYGRTLVNQATDALDKQLAQLAAQAGFHFVDVRSAFAGHGDCSLSPSWINPVLNLIAPLHPTADGYKYGYLAALEAVTG